MDGSERFCVDCAATRLMAFSTSPYLNSSLLCVLYGQVIGLWIRSRVRRRRGMSEGLGWLWKVRRSQFAHGAHQAALQSRSLLFHAMYLKGSRIVKGIRIVVRSGVLFVVVVVVVS